VLVVNMLDIIFKHISNFHNVLAVPRSSCEQLYNESSVYISKISYFPEVV